jgi:hypothetical protein
LLAVAFMATLAVAYLVALGSEAYSAWEASRMLAKLEALRVGSPVSEFDYAVRPCEVETTGSTHLYVMTAGPFRTRTPWQLLFKLPARIVIPAKDVLRRAGLRAWRIMVRPTVRDGRIRSLLVLFTLDRGNVALGAEWELSERFQERLERGAPIEQDPHTVFEIYHINTVPGGQGISVHTTSASTDEELRARHIDRNCLFSFGGCEGLSEVLPGVLPVLKAHGQLRIWCGCDFSTVPWCDLSKDKCRTELQELKRVSGCP